MSDPTATPERIWLEPACCADPDVGRCWATAPEHDCDAGEPWTEYVRTDLAKGVVVAAANLSSNHIDLQARYDILLRELQRERAESAKLKAELAPLRQALGLHPQPAPAPATPRSMEA